MNPIFKFCLVLAMAIASTFVSAQVTYDNNDPLFSTPPGFLGRNQVGADLDIRTNNDTRMKILQNAGPVTINSQLVDLSGHVAFGQDVTSGYLPLSPIHIFGSAPPLNAGYRNWMQYGTAYSVDGFDMYVGPAKIGEGDLNSVISWTRSVTSSPGVPGVLRFISTDGDGSGSDQFSQVGLEVARMTDEGRMGVGTGFSNTLQPIRALHTYHPSMPQFRLSQDLHEQTDEGNRSDFQVSSSGNLHIEAKKDESGRSIALGFLPGGAQAPPINSSTINTILDVGGITRIRNLPDTASNCLITGFNAPNSTASDNFLTRLDFLEGEEADCHVLGANGTWVDICGLGGEDFDWEYNDLDVWMGVPSDDFPTRNAGIGTSSPDAKLHIVNSENNPQSPNFSTSLRVGNTSSGFGGGIGVRIDMNTEKNADRALNARIQTSPQAPPAIEQIAGHFEVSANGALVIGTRSLINPPGNHPSPIGILAGVFSRIDPVTPGAGGITNEYGVYGETNCSGDFSAGIYGTVSDTAQVDCWAGFFDGPAFSTNFVQPSDESLKTNISEFDNALGMINALAPMKYEFIPSEQINLPSGEHYGLMAQNVEEIIPELVTTVATPSKLDTAGNVVADPLEFKAINYSGMIPILVAALKERAETTEVLPDLITQQEEEINALQDLVAAQAAQLSAMQDALEQAVATFDIAKRDMDSCCGGKAPAASPGGAQGEIILEQNYPNPFTSETRIDFYLPYDARIVLEVSDAQGRKLHTLIEGQFSEGNHSTTWDAGRYAPGIYYCSLYADGELITKKMIKM